jgi:hypothetical protein
MKTLISIFITLSLSFGSLHAKLNINILLEPSQTDSIFIVELPKLGIAIPLGGDSLMIVDNNLPVVHVKNYAGANNFIVTDSLVYYSADNFIYSLNPSNGDSKRVAVMDNGQFSLYPAVENSFFVVTSDDEYSRCQLFDPVNKVYSDVVGVEAPIYKVVANEQHVIVWAGDNLLLVGSQGKIAPLLTEPSLRDFVLTEKGIIFADEEGLYLIESITEQKLISTLAITRLWYVGDILYGLTDSGYLFAVYDE